MGWILVSDVALFVTEKLFPRKRLGRRQKPRLSSAFVLDDRAVQGLASDLSSCGIKLHNFASVFALTVQVGFVNDVQLEALFIPCGMIELEL